MTNAVVVVGSLHYDIVVDAPDRPRKGETVTGHKWYPKFGGKGGNQAVAAAKAGAETRFVGAVGTDGFAEVMLTTLREAGIATSHVAKLAECGTGMSVAITDAEGDYGAVIVSGANLQIKTTQFDDPAIWKDAKVLILQNEIPEQINISAARMARSKGLEICLNAAPWRSLSAELTELIDILVVNAVEAEDMGGGVVRDLGSAKQAAIALSAQVPTTIVTAGGDGVAWARRDFGAGSLPAHKLKVISTHGAGDMFIGTFCHNIALGEELEDAIKAANMSAAKHISQSHE